MCCFCKGNALSTSAQVMCNSCQKEPVTSVTTWKTIKVERLVCNGGSNLQPLGLKSSMLPLSPSMSQLITGPCHVGYNKDITSLTSNHEQLPGYFTHSGLLKTWYLEIECDQRDTNCWRSYGPILTLHMCVHKLNHIQKCTCELYCSNSFSTIGILTTHACSYRR